jgi:hypothetical protein
MTMTQCLSPLRFPSPPSKLLAVALCAAALVLAGCDKPASVSAPATPAPAPAPVAAPAAPPQPAQPMVTAAPAAPAAYTPPSADQLYEMVAPIALYPDKLVAQVLAGSTYPDQVAAADQWLAQNPGLKAGPLADAAEQQPWDASVKSLTAFKPVLDQMAKNMPWTTALGQAYYNDPDDVMNAIQVMRERASRAGKLQSTTRLRVATAAAPANYTPDPNAPLVYAGPPIIEPPAQFITIEPAQPEVVYVPAYDPQQIYGEPVPVYPGYAYAPPVYAGPNYSNAQIATAGVLSFGVGVVVGAALERHDWGWHAWGMHWGRPEAGRGRPPGGARAQAALDRPAVVYNRSTYISRSNTVVHNNIRNTVVNGANPQQLPAPQGQERQPQERERQPQAQLQQLQRQQAEQGRQAQRAQTQRAQAQHEQAQRAQARRMQTQREQAQQARAQQEQARQQQQTQQHHAREEARARQQQSQRQQLQQQQRYAQEQQARDQQAQARQRQEQQPQQQQRVQQEHTRQQQQAQAQQARAYQVQQAEQHRQEAQRQAQAAQRRAEQRQPH